MRRAVLFALCGCCLLPVVCSSADREESARFFSLSRAFEQSADKQLTLKQAQFFLKQFPGSGYAPKVRYISALCLGDTPEAIAKFQAVSKSYSLRRKYGQLDRSSEEGSLAVSSLYKIAEIYYRHRQYPEALNAFAALTDQFPLSVLEGEALCGTVQAQLASGQWAEAERTLEKIAAVRPDYLSDQRIHFANGLLLFQKHEYEKAYEQLKLAKSVEGLYYQGRCLEKLKRYLTAVVVFRQLLADFPDSHVQEEVQYLIADCFYRAGDYDVALSGYKDFLNTYPRSILNEDCSFQIGCCHFRKKNYPGAVAALKDVIASFPDGAYAPRAQLLIAETYMESRDYPKAAGAYKALINAYPGSADVAQAYYRMAWSHFNQKMYGMAIEDCKSMLRAYPEHELVSDALLLLAENFRRNGAYDDAVKAYEQIVWNTVGKPGNIEAALYMLTTTYGEQKKYNDIISTYHYALNTISADTAAYRPFTLLRVAEAYYYLGMYAESKALYDTVIEKYSFSRAAPMAIDGKAWVHFQRNEYDLAMRERESLLNAVTVGVSSASRISSEFEMGNISFNKKQYGEALDYYEKFIEKYPGNGMVPEALFYAGRCYYKLEYYTRAIEQWEKLAAGYKDHARTMEAVGIIADTYFRAQKYPQAIAAYRRALAAYPGTPLAKQSRLRIAQSYYNSSDNRRAIAEYDQFIRAYTEDPLAMDALEGIILASYKLAQAKADEGVDIKVMQQFIEQCPGTMFAAKVQYRMAERLYEKKDYKRAAAVFTEAYSNKFVGEKSADALFYSGESLYLSAQYDRAAPAYRRYIDNFPAHDALQIAYLHLANALYYLQRYEDAARVYLDLTQLERCENDMASTALLNAAVCYRKLEQWDQVVMINQRFIERFPASEKVKDVLLDQGETYESLVQPDQAIAAYAQLLGKLPGSDALVMELHYRIALLYFKGSAPEKGREELLKLVSGEPRDNTWRLAGLMRLGQEYEQDADWQRALEMYHQVLDAKPADKWVSAAGERVAAINALQKNNEQPAQ